MIVSNSTPLINFASIDRLDVLESLFQKIWIPSAVETEVIEKGKHYKSSIKLKQADFIHTKPVINIEHRNALLFDLDIGEAEAITIAFENNAELILLDEIAGRMVAEKYNLLFTGSIGCLVEAKRKNIIYSIKDLLIEMKIKANFWINPKLFKRVLIDNNEL